MRKSWVLAYSGVLSALAVVIIMASISILTAGYDYRIQMIVLLSAMLSLLFSLATFAYLRHTTTVKK
ncbi:MAG: hypothetical protein ABF966_09070 [Bifidobacterium psychraerophilum]|uniref:hypothetical protein n=1 Tax=Bifidobacterium psychraerophilum TaxID=218140 RepID=UPI0039EBD4BD